MIILGSSPLIIGFVAKISIVWTIGIVILVVGAISRSPTGLLGREVGRAPHGY